MMDRRSFLAGLTAPAFAAKAQSAGRRETLRVAPETLTNIFDPHFTTSFTTRDFSYLVFDTLFAVNDRWEPRPQMVERWDRSTDGMTWTFTLREGLAFHDGNAVTSEDCAASLRRWGARDALGGLPDLTLLEFGLTYSALILAARITFAHLAVSVLMTTANSSGELTDASRPSCAIRSRVSAFARRLHAFW